MPPKDKGRSVEKERLLSAMRPCSPSFASGVALKLEPDQNEASQPPAYQAQESDLDTDSASVTSKASQRGKKTKFHSSLTEEEEQDMVGWLENNPVIYNKKMKAYKDSKTKENLWREKAAELGKDVAELKIWYTSLRTRFGRLKRRMSGQGDVELTEREGWVYSHFKFLMPYIHEVQPKIAVSMKRKIAAASRASIAAEPDDEDIDNNAIDFMPMKSMAFGEQIVSTPSINLSAQSKLLMETQEESMVVAGVVSERSSATMGMQEDYLERQRGDAREREAYVDWIRSVISVLDHGLWRRCQRELTSVIYRYQAEDDDLRNLLPAAATSSHSASSSSHLW